MAALPTFFSVQDTLVGAPLTIPVASFGFIADVIEIDNLDAANTYTIAVITTGGSRSISLPPLCKCVIPGPLESLTVDGTGAVQAVAAPRGVRPGNIPAWPEILALSNAASSAVAALSKPQSFSVTIPGAIAAPGAPATVTMTSLPLYKNKTGRSVQITDIILRQSSTPAFVSDADDTYEVTIDKTGAVNIVAAKLYDAAPVLPVLTASDALTVISTAGANILAPDDELLVTAECVIVDGTKFVPFITLELTAQVL